MSSRITEFTYWPDGLDPATAKDPADLEDWAVRVVWMRDGVHRVEFMRSRLLSRGGKWKLRSMIRPYQYWQYRFTLEEAHNAAAREVNSVKISGMTYAEWCAWCKSKSLVS